MNTNFSFHRELLETFAYQINPAFAASVRSKYKQNRALGISLDEIPTVEETHALFTRKRGSGGMFSKLVVTDVERNSYAIDDTDDEAINVIYVTSAIMRNGGGCSIGSIKHREKLLYCATKPNVLGHIFILDTPGGCVDAIYDYKEGIEAVKAAGQPCIGLVTGDCASLGTRLSVNLDEVYYSNELYRFGCIGTMAICDLMAHGEKNPSTGETHVELYADDSPMKNFIYREASKGNYAPIQEHINKANEEFLTEMKTRRPNCKQEHLSGELFTCAEMDGIFLDGKKSFEECVDRIIELRGSAPSATATVSDASPEDSATVSDASPSASISTKSQKQTTMNFTLIETALGFPIEGLTEEGAFMNAALLESIENALSQKDASIADLTSAHATAIDELKQTHQTAIDELNSQIETLNATIAERDTTIAEREASIADFTAQVETLNATIVERDTTIAELSANPTSEQNPAPATAQEGEGDGNKQTPTSACASKAGMSLAERREAQRKRDEALGIK